LKRREGHDRTPAPGLVYVTDSPTLGLIKIGKTTDYDQRHRALESGNPDARPPKMFPTLDSYRVEAMALNYTKDRQKKDPYGKTDRMAVYGVCRSRGGDRR